MEHGGDLSEAMRRYGGSRADWLDLSTGINPWPWPVPDLASDVWRRLPSRDDEAALIAAAREAYAVPEAVSVVPAPGTQALIGWLPYLAAPGAVAIVQTTYAEHAQCWARAGHSVLDVERLEDMPDHARHAALVNPNNPDGRVIAREAVARAAERSRDRQGWIVVDESFADLTPGVSVVDLCATAPVVVLRSFGKFYGLAGLRLGFAIAAPAIAERIAGALGPWAVSGPALAIGDAALQDTAWAQATRRRLGAEAARLDALLAEAGLAIVGGTALFRLARHADAHGIHLRLARHRIWTRRFGSHPELLRFGLPADEAARERLANALLEIV